MQPVHWAFEAIGTAWEIDAVLPEDVASTLQTEVRARIEAFDKQYSRFRDDSLVSEIARKAGTHTMPEDFAPMWELYSKLYVQTDGAVNPLVGKLLENAGYDRHYSFQERDVAPAPSLDVVSFDAPNLSVSQPVLIDVGAAGKGYIVDIVAEILRSRGALACTVEAGGDIAHAGGMLRVALEDPEDPSLAIGVIEIGDESICASAGNRRKWGKFHHIIDPRTAESPTQVLATWVVAQGTMLADGLATALFFVEPARLSGHIFDWAIMQADRSVRFSPRFKELFQD